MLDDRLKNRIRNLGVKNPESPTGPDISRILRANLAEKQLSTNDLTAYLSAVRPLAEVLRDGCRIALNEWVQASKSFRETLEKVAQICTDKLASAGPAEQEMWWARICQVFQFQQEEADKARTTWKQLAVIAGTALVLIVALVAGGAGGRDDGFSGRGFA